MKQINFELNSFYGYGCSGCSYSSEEKSQISIEDNAAQTLRQMMTDKGISEEEVLSAIEAGHTELQPVHDKLHDLALDMDARYWLFEADNECLDECLEQYFDQDIEDGLYEPSISMEEYERKSAEDAEKEDDEDFDEETSWSFLSYFDVCRDEYLEWVNSHDDDYWFIAERVGLDLALVYEDSEATYTITEVEE